MSSKNITHMQGETLLIRADATVAMGTGHIMRCLALAQAWQDAGGQCRFAIAQASPALLDRLRAENIQIERIEARAGSDEDNEQLCKFAAKQNAAWVVVDGYHFGAQYQLRIKKAGLRLLCVDDHGHAGHYSADLVLNQNFHANEETYAHCEPYTELLLGPKYILLRREFLANNNGPRHIAETARKLLVTMGGSDPENLTVPVLRALSKRDFFDLAIIVVSGAENPHASLLNAAADSASGRLRMVRNAGDMDALMRWADLAITIAGGTVWELFSLGCPSLVYGRDTLQAQMNRSLHEQGRLVDMGHSGKFDPDQLTSNLEKLIPSRARRAEMSKLCREYADGKGALRLLEKMQHPLGRPVPARSANESVFAASVESE